MTGSNNRKSAVTPLLLIFSLVKKLYALTPLKRYYLVLRNVMFSLFSFGTDRQQKEKKIKMSLCSLQQYLSQKLSHTLLYNYEDTLNRSLALPAFVFFKKALFTLLLGTMLFIGQKAHAAEITLGPEGEYVYNYLVLTDALLEGDEIHIEKSIQNLLKDEPSLAIFQDGATILLSRKNYAAAKATAEKGLKAFPHDSVLTNLLSAALSEAGDENAAITVLKSHLVNVPTDNEAKQELVRLYLREGSEDKARLLLKEMDQEEENPMVSFFRCKLLVTTEKYSQAKVELKKLLKEYPQFIEAWIELGFIAEQENNTETAITSYKKALSIMKDNNDIRLHVIQLLLSQNKLGDVLTLANESPNPSDFKLQLSIILTQKGYFKQAKMLVDEAKQAGANAQLAAIYLSNILYSESHDPLKALGSLNEVPESSSLFMGIAQRKVELLVEAKQEIEANKLATRIRKKSPKDPLLWGLEAYTFFKIGKQKKAIDTLEKGIALAPDNQELLLALGSMQDEMGENDAAMATMERLIKLNPKNYRALNYIGYSLALEKKDLDRALKLLTTALEESPNADYILDSLAWLYYQMGKYENAWTIIQQCTELMKENATVSEHYADIALSLGKKEIAISAYKEALKLNPENSDEIKAKLRKLEK